MGNLQKFKTSLNGYNKEEVNHFVFEVTQEYEGMLNNLKSRDAEIASLKARLQEYQNMESTLNKALLVAENAGNQIRKVARDESKAILDDAKRNASRIVNDALLKAEKMEADGELLRQRIMSFKRRFRAIVETELDAIEQIDEKY